MKMSAYVATAAGAAGHFLGISAASAADAAKGKEYFLKFQCSSCHGTVGQGANTGPKLAPEPLPHDAMMSFVRNSTGQMPAYTAVILDDAKFADIHAYLSSQPKTQDSKTIPLLNQN